MFFEISIFAGVCFFHQARFLAGVQMLFDLHYTVFKSMQEHFVSSHQWNNVDCKVQKYFKTLCTLTGCSRQWWV